MSQHVTLHGKTSQEFNGQDGKWIPVKVNDAGQLSISALAGEISQLNRLAGGAITKYAVVSADTAVVTGPAILYGIFCTSAGTMAGVYDNVTATGNLLIPSSALTAGQSVLFGGAGILCTTGIFADWTSGTFLVLYVDAV
jgi:hypothetical protein